MPTFYKCSLVCMDLTSGWRLLASVQWRAMLVSGDNGAMKGALLGEDGMVTHSLPTVPTCPPSPGPSSGRASR